MSIWISRRQAETKRESLTHSQQQKMNVIAEIHRINERELELGVPYEGSWHQKYKESAWVYVGGLPYELTEGDVICVLSQFGEIEDINLVRDGKTGKSKGFAFIKYENQRSTVLAVDNMNGARILERVIRVDHVLKYKLPKEIQDREDAKENALTSDEEGGGGDGDDATKVRYTGLYRNRFRLRCLRYLCVRYVMLLTHWQPCIALCFIDPARLAWTCVRRQGVGWQVRYFAWPQCVCCTRREQERAQAAQERGEETQKAREKSAENRSKASKTL